MNIQSELISLGLVTLLGDAGLLSGGSKLDLEIVLGVALVVHALKDLHGLKREVGELVALASGLVLSVGEDLIGLVGPSARPDGLCAQVEVVGHLLVGVVLHCIVGALPLERAEVVVAQLVEKHARDRDVFLLCGDKAA